MRTITMKEYGLCRYDDASTFALGDLELSMNNIPSKSGEFRFCGFCNGKQVVKATVTAEKNTVTIPAGKLEAGKFAAYVMHLVGGQEVKRYPIEALLIAEVNGTLTADPEIAALTGQKNAHPDQLHCQHCGAYQDNFPSAAFVKFQSQ